ncbi:hypothetical protein ACFZAR_20220 [Streptomyces sp. NPDC008222]|uniref:hypothetical protein n=1 Tax=Streptomyces sp. NPDC008222 TaxID=3364820 RepID=UPI0036E41F69
MTDDAEGDQVAVGDALGGIRGRRRHQLVAVQVGVGDDDVLQVAEACGAGSRDQGSERVGEVAGVPALPGGQ